MRKLNDTNYIRTVLETPMDLHGSSHRFSTYFILHVLLFFLLDYIQLTFFVGNEAIMALLKTTQKDSKIHGLT